MKDKDQITHFANDFDNLIGRYRQEYDITFAAVVGVLEIQKHLLLREAESSVDEQEGE